MKRISRRTLYLKRLLPAAMIAIACLPIVLIYLETGRFQPETILPAAFVVLILAIIYPLLIRDLADEVYDGGDYLLVKRGRIEDRIALSDVMNVNSSMMVNPPRITLRLAKPSKFGDEVVFSPLRPPSLNPFARNAIADDLVVRVDTARVKRAKS